MVDGPQLRTPGPGAGGDWCYFLGPGLDVTRARQVEVGRDPETGDYAVNVALVPAGCGGGGSGRSNMPSSTATLTASSRASE